MQDCVKSHHKNHEIRRNLNIVKKQYKKLLKFKKIEWTNEIYSELEKCESENPKRYWDIIKDIREDKHDSNINNIKKFENYYKNLYCEHKIEEDNYQEVNKLIEQMLKEQSNITEDDFNMKEFNDALKKLKNNKSVGPDRIPTEMLKNSPLETKQIILKLMNKIKKLYQYPKLWALGNTTLIHKDGDEENPNNYRAITIGSAMSKLFALIINNRLKKIVKNKNLIGDYQIGFKKGARPADHIFVLKSIIDTYIQKYKKIFACFIDYQKAYDNVWREGLYFKLLKNEINSELVSIIRSMYVETTQQLKIGNKLTKPFNSYRGVRQACV